MLTSGRRHMITLASVGMLLTLAGCGSGATSGEEATGPVMPDVVGKTLDLALSDVERSGFGEDVEVLGGGTFGVVVEANWTVCSQDPAGGDPITATPRLTVDRECAENKEAEADTTDEEAAPDEVDEPEEAEEAPEPEPETTVPEPDPEPVGNLTVENSPELAALLTVPSNCDDSIAAFASTHRGRTIEFDGSIGAMNNHGDYETRVDILIGPGDGGTSTTGPNFQFRNVSIVNDLNLTGPNIPDNLAVGQNLRIVAEVESYNSDQCLFFLKPVATVVR